MTQAVPRSCAVSPPHRRTARAYGDGTGGVRLAVALGSEPRVAVLVLARVLPSAVVLVARPVSRAPGSDTRWLNGGSSRCKGGRDRPHGVHRLRVSVRCARAALSAALVGSLGAGSHSWGDGRGRWSRQCLRPVVRRTPV